jgi:hypothetical protein
MAYEEVRMVDGPNHEQISRRKALRRLGAAGALVWTVPAIQTIRMSRAMAQTPPGSAPPPGCGNARVSLGGGCALPNFNASAGCGGQSCLSGANQDAPSACGSIVSATANDGADWVICLAEGCRVQALSMAAAGSCWNSVGGPSCQGSNPHVTTWSGYSVSGSCVTVHRPTFVNTPGQTVQVDISHVDLVICCAD